GLQYVQSCRLIGVRNCSNARRIAGTVITGSLPPFFPAEPGVVSRAIAPTPGIRTPASPGRCGGENHARTGPRNDPGPALPSSAGNLARPATGSSTAAPPGSGGCPPAGYSART